MLGKLIIGLSVALLSLVSCGCKDNVIVKKCQFNGNREKVRQSSTATALTLLRGQLLKNIG